MSESLVLFENLSSPELLRKYNAQRLSIIHQQKAPTVPVEHFIEHANFVHHKGSHILDDDFHCVPTKDNKTGARSYISIASVHWFGKRANAFPGFQGLVGPHFGFLTQPDQDGVPGVRWLDWWPFEGVPSVGRCGVRLEGYPEPEWFYGTWNEFGNDQATWKNKPLHMFAKCLRVNALRKAIPAAFGSNVYIREEMADVLVTVEDTPPKEQQGSRPRPVPVQAEIVSEPAREVEEEQIQDGEVEEAAEAAQEAESATPAPGTSGNYDQVDPHTGKLHVNPEVPFGSYFRTKPPEEAAKCRALMAEVNEGVKKHTSTGTGNPKWIDVRAVCSMLENPGPVGRVQPKWEEWDSDQLEELANKYKSFDLVPYVRPEDFEKRPDTKEEPSPNQETKAVETPHATVKQTPAQVQQATPPPPQQATNVTPIRDGQDHREAGW